MAIQLERRRFTADEYHQMIEAGVFQKEERLELIDGEIVEMSPIGDPHMACVRRLTALFAPLVPRQALLDVQNAVRVGPMYVPRPEVALLRPRADFYASGTPTPADCWLVIEVADTSAEFDRQVKMPRYARGGVPELWVVDLQRDAVVVYRDPAGDGYQEVHLLRRGDEITLAALGLTVQLDSILG